MQIRPLESIDEFDAMIELQRRIWGYSDLEAESRGILTVASRFAGQLLGAFIGQELVGFALAFVGLETSSLHSHRVGVHPTNQNAGVGFALKLAQREYALKQGYQFIHWTFDPLQPRNAHFNLHKLGGYARRIFPNLYGTGTSPLHGGLPTDRLLVEWDLHSERVLSVLSRRREVRDENVTRIPLVTDNSSPGIRNQQRLRNRLNDAFCAGLTVTDFETHGSSGDYILERV
jgi:predicted GNAT superfamily acetyltransferase